MPAVISTIAIQDTNGAAKSVNVVDISGNGAGPFIPLHALVDASGVAYGAGNPMPINDANGSLTVDGAISVTNFPATQAVAGTVAISNAIALDATITARLGTLGQKAAAASTPVVIASDQGAVPSDTVVRSSSTDRGGTITTGGTAQTMMPANTTRRGIVVQNQSTGDLYINGLGAAVIGPSCLKIVAGQTYESPAHHVGTGAISIIGPTTGQAFYGREF